MAFRKIENIFDCESLSGYYSFRQELWTTGTNEPLRTLRLEDAMAFVLMVLALTAYSVTIEVQDFPCTDNPVYLTYMETMDGWEIALALAPDSAASPISNYAGFPGSFNSAKAYAEFDEDTSILSVYSVYPFSADYFLATYRLEETGNLTLLDAADHDYYLESLNDIRSAVDSGNINSVIDAAWSVMYPGANPFAKEMCILLLKAGLDHADALINEGESIQSATRCFDDIRDVTLNLSNDELHRIILSAGSYPDDFNIDLEEYIGMLYSYSKLLEESGDSDTSNDVLRVIRNLEKK